MGAAAVQRRATAAWTGRVQALKEAARAGAAWRADSERTRWGATFGAWRRTARHNAVLSEREGRLVEKRAREARGVWIAAWRAQVAWEGRAQSQVGSLERRRCAGVRAAAVERWQRYVRESHHRAHTTETAAGFCRQRRLIW